MIKVILFSVQNGHKVEIFCQILMNQIIFTEQNLLLFVYIIEK